jgi:hypothetical protein
MGGIGEERGGYRELCEMGAKFRCKIKNLLPLRNNHDKLIEVKEKIVRKVTLSILCMVIISNVCFADSPAGHLIGYAETDGYCIVNGQRLHYWMYNTYIWHNGQWGALKRELITYAERLGWTIDYENYWEALPNNALAQSVKRMMEGKQSDVSMTIIENGRKGTLVFNLWDIENNYWWSEFYPLIK